MKFFKAILSGIISASALLAIVNSNPIPDGELGPQGYTVVPLTFVGSVGPNSQNVTFTGTVQEIHSQIRKINPTYKHGNQTTSDDVTGLEKRGTKDTRCEIPYGGAKLDHISQGIKHLRNSDGKCYVDAGPRVCARISCSYNSAIYLCNDNTEAISPYCATLANDFAQPIVDKCVGSGAFKVHGQTFDSDGYNVIIMGSKC